jgi:putative transposase
MENMCQVLSVSRSGYYSWRNRRKIKRAEANEKLTERINVWTKEGWMYLSVILDVYSRMVVGWSLQARLHKRLVLDALRDAVQIRPPEPGLIFHLVRGSQYASNDVQRAPERYKMQGSMSGKGNCHDNAISESFFGSL